MMAHLNPWPLTPDFSLLWAPRSLWTSFIIFCLVSQSLECFIMCGCPVGSSFLFCKSSFRIWHSALYIIITIKWRPPTFAYHASVSKVLLYPFCDLAPWQSGDKSMIVILLLQTRNLCPASSLLRYSDAECQHSATLPYGSINLCWFHATWLVASIWMRVQEVRSSFGLFFVVAFVAVHVFIIY